jgi:PAS domain S-box-containing protein
MFKFKSIKSRFIFTILSLGVATLLFSGLVNQYITSKAITENEKNKLEELPRQIGRSIDSLLYYRWSTLQLYSSFLSSSGIEGGLFRAEVLRNLSALYAPYSWVGVIDEKGKVLFSNDPRFVGMDMSDRPWFNNARDTMFTLVGDVRSSEQLYGEPAVNFTSPIHGPDGGFKGVVHTSIGLDYIAGSLKNFKLGETGYLLLVRKDGKVIADSSGAISPLSLNVGGLQAFKLVQEGKSGMIRETDPLGVDSFISYQSLGGFMEYPGMGWSILAIQSAREVMAHARKQTKATVLIILIGIGIFSLGGLVEAKGITGPITKIFNQVSEFSRGDYSQPLEVTSDDELGKLARSFNEMAKSLTERENQLRSALNYLDNLVSSSVDTIITTDVHGRITFLNTAAERLLEYNLDEDESKHIWEFYAGGKKEAVRIMQRLKAQGNYKSFETEVLTSSGRIIPMSISASLLKNEKGEVMGTLGIGKDITETKELQGQLVHQEKMAGVGMLAAGIAHEIGNPLTSLSSLVQILKRKVSDNNTAEKLDFMGEHIEKISKIVRELVDFSRPPSYQWKYSQVNDIISAAVGLMKYDRRGKYVKVETHLDSDLPMVRIIEDQLLQVFLNIILNAFDAMDKGGKLTIKSYRDAGYIRVSFKDTGEGIPKGNLDKIFDPFFTTKEVGKGTGLGLSVSYGVLKNLGGEISAQNGPERGAVFTVSLPINERSDDG